MKELIIKVNGMSCGGCENRIKNALSTIKGVKNVEADYKTGIVKIRADKIVRKEEIKEIIEDIGFEVEK